MQYIALGHSFKRKYIKNGQMISSNLKILFSNALKIANSNNVETSFILLPVCHQEHIIICSLNLKAVHSIALGINTFRHLVYANASNTVQVMWFLWFQTSEFHTSKLDDIRPWPCNYFWEINVESQMLVAVTKHDDTYGNLVISILLGHVWYRWMRNFKLDKMLKFHQKILWCKWFISK